MFFSFLKEIYFYYHLYDSYFKLCCLLKDRESIFKVYSGYKSGNYSLEKVKELLDEKEINCRIYERRYLEKLQSLINKDIAKKNLKHNERILLEGWSAINKYLREYSLEPFVDDEFPWSVLDFNINLKEVPKNNYLVSIIVPAYNVESTIKNAINSLIHQSYKNIEIIIINDGSTDKTLEAINEIAKKDSRIRVVNNKENLGVYRSRNLALKYCHGEFITIHDADDISHPRKIEIQTQPFNSNHNIIGTISYWIRFDSRGELSLSRGLPLLRLNISSFMLRKRTIIEMGGWQENRFGADTEFFERCSMKFGSNRILKIKKPLAFGLFRENSLTTENQTSVFTSQGLKKRVNYEEKWRREHLAKFKPTIFQIIKCLDKQL